uniref:NADH-ubiquinone oxidoreductase chain 6 n=1 Tax=Sparassis crispa TaxID=139825 RepID=A0A6N0GSF8_9APHY|nr:Nad6 [Sparassis crispa]
MKNLLIDILAFATLFSSVLVITSKNPVIAVIFLISVFVNAAGYLMASGIGFIGLAYIIVYIGAIAVLFLFVVMMINIKLTDILEAGNLYTKNIPLAIAVGFFFIYEIFTIMPFTFNNVLGISSLLNILTILNGILTNTDFTSLIPLHITHSPVIADTNFISFTQIESIGQYIYTSAAILLIITSVILLLAMVAPIFISKNSKYNIPFPYIARAFSFSRAGLR